MSPGDDFQREEAITRGILLVCLCGLGQALAPRLALLAVYGFCYLLHEKVRMVIIVEQVGINTQGGYLNKTSVKQEADSEVSSMQPGILNKSVESKCSSPRQKAFQ